MRSLKDPVCKYFARKYAAALFLAVSMTHPQAEAYFGGELVPPGVRSEIVFFTIESKGENSISKEKTQSPSKTSPKTWPNTWKEAPSSLRLKEANPDICSATQIRKRVFLTAAHCLVPWLPSWSADGAPALIRIGQITRPGYVRTRVFTLKRWAAAAGAEQLTAGAGLFSDIDLGLFEVQEELPAMIGVASLSADEPRVNQEILIAGFGQSGLFTLGGLRITDRTGTLQTGELRSDARLIGRLDGGNFLSLMPKREATRKFERLESFIPMSRVYPGPKPKDSQALKAWDEEQFQKRIERPHRFNQMIVGDSGGPAYALDARGSRRILAVNSMRILMTDLLAVAPERVPPGADQESLAIDFLARVDGASAGGAWVRAQLQSAAFGTPGESADDFAGIFFNTQACHFDGHPIFPGTLQYEIKSSNDGVRLECKNRDRDLLLTRYSFESINEGPRKSHEVEEGAGIRKSSQETTLKDGKLERRESESFESLSPQLPSSHLSASWSLKMIGKGRMLYRSVQEGVTRIECELSRQSSAGIGQP